MSLDNWDGTARAVLFGLADATVRTMALAALAAATLAILRVKHPAARLRVWTFVLCAALLLPLADWLLPDLTVPLPLFVLTPATTLANVQIASPFSIQSVETARAGIAPDAAGPSVRLRPRRGGTLGTGRARVAGGPSPRMELRRRCRS